MAVRVIPARRREVVTGNQEKRKVAAYCRVSTDLEEQESSYEVQVQHYTDYINSNPSWMLAGIFADEGITGTSTRNRTAFNQMMEEARAGKINYIITKSISRFARNTLDCLKYVRELKELNIPVLFEKENINTLDSKGEVMITVMASLAQQESESISRNLRMGIQYRYQQGIVMVNHSWLLGYTKERGGKLQVVPEEAQIVRRIYREFMDGANYHEIARGLVADGIKSPAGKDNWSVTCIKSILCNEKYIGDALLQKMYVKDCLSHKLVKNHGELPQYYVENDHEAIIPRELFYLVQGEIHRRESLYKQEDRRGSCNTRYALSGRMICGQCGASYKRYANSGKGWNTMWRCRGRAGGGCSGRSIAENVAQDAVLQAIAKLSDMIPEMVLLCEETNRRISELNDSIAIYDGQIREMQDEISKQFVSGDEETLSQMTEKLDALKAGWLKEGYRRADFVWKYIQTKKLIQIAENHAIKDYEEIEIRKILENVYVAEEGYTVTFRNGLSVEV